jgi:hypothetical protein
VLLVVIGAVRHRPGGSRRRAATGCPNHVKSLVAARRHARLRARDGGHGQVSGKAGRLPKAAGVAEVVDMAVGANRYVAPPCGRGQDGPDVVDVLAQARQRSIKRVAPKVKTPPSAPTK